MAVSNVATVQEERTRVFRFSIPIQASTPNIDFRPPVPVCQEKSSRLSYGSLSVLCEFDEKDRVLSEDCTVTPLPLNFVMEQAYSKKEIFEVDHITEDEVEEATGALWSMCKTTKGQDLLTVWDTGSGVSVVPLSSVELTKTPWSATSDVEFGLADGVVTQPLGHAPKFMFQIGDVFFATRVYIVQEANYQLLLGTAFMVKTGAGLFPRCTTVKITIPCTITVSCVCMAVDSKLEPKRLHQEDSFEGLEGEFFIMPPKAEPTTPRRQVAVSSLALHVAPVMSVGTRGKSLIIGTKDRM